MEKWTNVSFVVVHASIEPVLDKNSYTSCRVRMYEESVELFSYESAQEQQDTVSATTSSLNNEQQHQQREREPIVPVDELVVDNFQLKVRLLQQTVFSIYR